MIEYEFGRWGVGFLCSLYGSVFPRAMAWALPAGVLSAVYCQVFKHLWGAFENYPEVGGTSFTIVWGGYTFIVGFLLVFRTQIAFARFWEGAKVLWYIKGVWMNATSNSLAFTTTDPKKVQEADAFQHLLVRLMSMLYSAALEAINTDASFDFRTLGEDGLSEEHMLYLSRAEDKVEVLLNWVQRALVRGHHTGVLSIPPPILSRVFQELGNGIREFQGARRISEVPFPFPYAQAISLFLLFNWLFLPVIGAYFITNELGAAMLTVSSVFAVWSITYIAAELEMPFGGDPNDLPLATLQSEFNEGLRMLMHPLTRSAPTISYDAAKHDKLEQQQPLIPGCLKAPRSSAKQKGRLSIAAEQSDGPTEPASSSSKPLETAVVTPLLPITAGEDEEVRN
eukprot:TRINITY_DN4980_c0_g3_i2.p1 TRINITY_DN4980_c0_g3~~TRINITY_DN4980_c0_g3_i2.p1  ORF type:complete len:396 (+),score=83.16 TRINITY_DN4980_c0_g3_i2:61-1248(+)